MFFCEACGSQCNKVVADFGVGPTQCGSYWQNDTRYACVSRCCDAPTITSEQAEEMGMQYQVVFNHPIKGKQSFLFDDLIKADDSLRLIINRWPYSKPHIELYGPIPEQSEEFLRVHQLRVAHFDIPLEDAEYVACDVLV